jgi:exopolyphosphatase/guanosine-5'-triphosphate,3'-diphosphate pyrophosphatase
LSSDAGPTQVVAIIDVGTNSVKFHIGRHDGPGRWSTVADRSEVTRLGEGLERTGELAPPAIRRTADAIAGMAEEARRHDVSRLLAVGTMGLRTARNADRFRDVVRDRCGLDIEVISGEEEGRLAYVAVAAGLSLGGERLVVFDTGGGSTQFTYGAGGHVDDRFSLNVGAVRVTEKYGLDHEVSAERVREAMSAVAGEFARISAAAHPDVLVGMGGAVTNMTAVSRQMETYDADLVQGSVLELAEVDRQIELYRTRDAEARRAIVGLQPRRAEVILAGACIVRTVVDLLGKDALTVSDRGLRHGLLIDRFGR